MKVDLFFIYLDYLQEVYSVRAIKIPKMDFTPYNRTHTDGCKI